MRRCKCDRSACLFRLLLLFPSQVAVSVNILFNLHFFRDGETKLLQQMDGNGILFFDQCHHHGKAQHLLPVLQNRLTDFLCITPPLPGLSDQEAELHLLESVPDGESRASDDLSACFFHHRPNPEAQKPIYIADIILCVAPLILRILKQPLHESGDGGSRIDPVERFDVLHRGFPYLQPLRLQDLPREIRFPLISLHIRIRFYLIDLCKDV